MPRKAAGIHEGEVAACSISPEKAEEMRATGIRDVSLLFGKSPGPRSRVTPKDVEARSGNHHQMAAAKPQLE